MERRHWSDARHPDGERMPERQDQRQRTDFITAHMNLAFAPDVTCGRMQTPDPLSRGYVLVKILGRFPDGPRQSATACPRQSPGTVCPGQRLTEPGSGGYSVSRRQMRASGCGETPPRMSRETRRGSIPRRRFRAAVRHDCAGFSRDMDAWATKVAHQRHPRWPESVSRLNSCFRSTTLRQNPWTPGNAPPTS